MATPTGGLKGAVRIFNFQLGDILCTYLGQLLCHNYYFLISFEPYMYIVTWEKKLTMDSNVFFIFHHPFTLTFINQ